MKALTIIGAIVAMAVIILNLLYLGDLIDYSYISWDYPVRIGLNYIIHAIIGIVGVVLTLLCALKPGDPIPFNWIILLIFAIWLIIFGSVWGGVLVFIAFLIGLIEDL